MTTNTKKTQEALRMALEALEESHPEAYRHSIAAIREALAEQPAQQEPIAWIYKPHMELLWPDEIEAKDPSKHRDYTPLYTSPPNVPTARASKPWVGLTGYEANDIMEKESWGPGAISLNSQLIRTIRRTEAKLRERNEHWEKNA